MQNPRIDPKTIEARQRLAKFGCLIFIIVTTLITFSLFSFLDLPADNMWDALVLFTANWMMTFMFCTGPILIVLSAVTVFPKQSFEFIQSRYTLVVAACFLGMYLLSFLVSTIYEIGFNNLEVLRFGWSLILIFAIFVLMMALIGVRFFIRLNIGRSISIAVIAILVLLLVPFGIYWFVLPSYGLPQQEWKFPFYTLEDLIIGSIFFLPVFWVVWGGWTGIDKVYRRAPAVLRELNAAWWELNRFIPLFPRIFVLGLAYIAFAVFTEMLGETRNLVFNALGFAIQVRYIIIVLSFVLFTITGVSNLLLTLTYMDKPQLMRSFFPGSQVFGIFFALFLLFLSWCYTLVASVMQVDLLFPGSYVYLNIPKPDLSDYMLYTFSVMTTSNFSNMQAVSRPALWLNVMMTAVGILIFVVFIGVALSSLGNKGSEPPASTTKV
jgi:hypothetical protein